MNMSRTMFVALLLFAIVSSALTLVAPPLEAQVTRATPVLATPPPAAQGVGGHLDPQAATQAYLATLPADKKA